MRPSETPTGSSSSQARPGEPSRRGFLKATAAVLGASMARVPTAKGFEELALPPGTPASRVVIVRHPKVLDGPKVHRPLLGEMVEAALKALTDAPSIEEAWASLLRSDDVIGIKFNRSGRRLIATSDEMAEALVTSLTQAGWKPQQIVLIEAPEGTAEKLGTLPALSGYRSEETTFASGSDRFAAVLDQI
ncbi:MAG: twin-arginine translocation signal domain-containing protein, partial [Planctomycetota bacterium]